MREKTKRRRERFVLGTALLATGYGAQAGASVYSFAGTADSTWSNPANWIGGVAPPATDPTTDIVVAGDLHTQGALTQDRDDDTINSFTIQSFSNSSTGTLSVTGTDPLVMPAATHILRLGAGGITDTAAATVAFQGTTTATSIKKLVLTADQTWNINTGGTQIFSMRRTIEGNFKVTKIGPSTLEFQGDNSNWTGGLDLQEGTVRLSGLTVNGVVVNHNPAGLGTLTINTANNVAFSSSGSGEAANADQIFNQWMDLGGTGSINLAGSRPYEFNGTVNFLSAKAINVGSTLPLFVNGVISGTGTLVKRGAGSMTISGSSSTFTGGVSVEGGTIIFSGFDKLGPGVSSINLATGATTSGALKITGSTSTNRPINVRAPGGTLDFDSTVTINNTIGGTGALTKNGNGTLVVNAIRVGTLSFGSGVVHISPNGTAAGTSKLTALTASGQLDLDNNSLVIDYDPALNPNTFQNTMNAVVSGYHGGDWIGNGIASSAAAAKVGSAHPTAVGYGDASVLGLTTFSGQTFDNTSVIVSYTLAGDTNLDGVVNSLDFNSLASNFGAASPVWTQGDFDFNANVNTVDFNLLAQNFNLTTTAVGSPGLGALVPEPAALLLAPVIALAARRRSRRKNVRAM